MANHMPYHQKLTEHMYQVREDAGGDDILDLSLLLAGIVTLSNEVVQNGREDDLMEWDLANELEMWEREESDRREDKFFSHRGESTLRLGVNGGELVIESEVRAAETSSLHTMIGRINQSTKTVLLLTEESNIDAVIDLEKTIADIFDQERYLGETPVDTQTTEEFFKLTKKEVPAVRKLKDEQMAEVERLREEEARIKEMLRKEKEEAKQSTATARRAEEEARQRLEELRSAHEQLKQQVEQQQVPSGESEQEGSPGQSKSAEETERERLAAEQRNTAFEAERERYQKALEDAQNRLREQEEEYNRKLRLAHEAAEERRREAQELLEKQQQARPVQEEQTIFVSQEEEEQDSQPMYDTASEAERALLEYARSKKVGITNVSSLGSNLTNVVGGARRSSSAFVRMLSAFGLQKDKEIVAFYEAMFQFIKDSVKNKLASEAWNPILNIESVRGVTPKSLPGEIFKKPVTQVNFGGKSVLRGGIEKFYENPKNPRFQKIGFNVGAQMFPEVHEEQNWFQ